MKVKRSTTTSGRSSGATGGIFMNHYRDDFDYFHIGGDDTFVIADNLRSFWQGPKFENRTTPASPCTSEDVSRSGNAQNPHYSTRAARAASSIELL